MKKIYLMKYGELANFSLQQHPEWQTYRVETRLISKVDKNKIIQE